MPSKQNAPDAKPNIQAADRETGQMAGRETGQASKVHFCDFRTTPRMNLLQKMDRLVKLAGLESIDMQNKYVAIKVHFGEPGNLAFLRPNFAKVLVDLVKARGGRPFLTDCNTLYVGRRKNALDHLDAAYENGYTPFSTGCHVIIADGLKGTDEALVPVEGDHVRTARIGRAVMDADIVISLTHFKLHELCGIGGAVKNIGMGCGSRAGKMEMHSAGKPSVKDKRCRACGACIRNCDHDAISLTQDHKAVIDHTRCAGCGRCIGICNFDAIIPVNDEANDILNAKVAEYAKAVLDGRPHFHVSLVMDVSPYCDCHSENDAPIIPDVGLFASLDPVALDLACADAVNRQPVAEGSLLSERKRTHGDHFRDVHPVTNWRSGIDHAVRIDLGNGEYELVTFQH